MAHNPDPVSPMPPLQKNTHALPSTTAKLIALVVLFALVVVLRLTIGPTAIDWPFADGGPWRFRLFRLLSGSTIGIALAVSGVCLQALLRNPLAEPFILGLSSGAAVGVILQRLTLLLLTGAGVMVQHYERLGAIHLGALVGAGATMSIVLLASRRRGVIDPLGLLLTGVVISTINGAIIMFANYITGPAGIVVEINQWMMGYLSENVGYPTLVPVACVTLAGLGLVLMQSRAMDVASFSQTEARSMGVHVARLRLILFAVASILAAGAVVLAGPIAFVGLVCPHVGRLYVGPRHGPLLIASALLGAMLILLADASSALIHLFLQTGLMPLGIFTAIVGGPVFLWMLRPQLGRGD
ncbi:MAG: iron chelate uptake ABC transporter family permease subunit [Phycisphaera sp.]|nr:iron chelate uptake ABC transporter family permease subunit [Phycisphaera sp.]